MKKSNKEFDEKKNPLRFIRQMNTKKLNKFLSWSNEFIEELETCTNTCGLFWSILLQDSPDPARLNTLGIRIADSSKRINKIYNKVIKQGIEDSNFLYKYYIFLKYVLYDETCERIAVKYFSQ